VKSTNPSPCIETAFCPNPAAHAVLPDSVPLTPLGPASMATVPDDWLNVQSVTTAAGPFTARSSQAAREE